MTSTRPAPGASPLLFRGGLLAAAGVAATLGAAVALRESLAQDDAYPVRAGVVSAAILTVALAGLRQSHPHPRLGPANVVTAGRTVVLSLLAGVALAPQTPASGWLLVLIATLGALADALDGRLARQSGLVSRFGARFDMEVDALLVLVLAALAWRLVPLGPWILAAGLMRYLFVVAGWIWPWLAAELPPSRRRQAVCVVQIAALIIALAPIVTQVMATVFAAASLVLLAWSFAVDVNWLATHRVERSLE